MANTNALAVREVQSTAIEPTTMGELVTFAQMAAKSGFFGTSPEQALMIAMVGRDIGFSYSQAMRAFYVVKGKPTLSADGMVAAVLASGECDYFRAVEVTEDSATWETRRKGSQPRRYTFTMADARRAGIANDMYQKHPKRMLSARAKSYLARDEYPDVLLGLVTEDEAHEIAASPATRTPAPPVQYAAEPVREPEAPRSTIVDDLAACQDDRALAALWKATASERKSMGANDQAALRDMFSARKAELAEVARAAQPAPATEEHDAEPTDVG